MSFIPYCWDPLKLHGGGGHGACRDNFLSMSHVPGTVPHDTHSIHSVLLIPIMLTTQALRSPYHCWRNEDTEMSNGSPKVTQLVSNGSGLHIQLFQLQSLCSYHEALLPCNSLHNPLEAWR